MIARVKISSVRRHEAEKNFKSRKSLLNSERKIDRGQTLKRRERAYRTATSPPSPPGDAFSGSFGIPLGKAVSSVLALIRVHLLHYYPRGKHYICSRCRVAQKRGVNAALCRTSRMEHLLIYARSRARRLGEKRKRWLTGRRNRDP